MSQRKLAEMDQDERGQVLLHEAAFFFLLRAETKVIYAAGLMSAREKEVPPFERRPSEQKLKETAI